MQTRRNWVKNIALAGTALAAAPVPIPAVADDGVYRMKGNVNHSVCRWCYSQLSVDELCRTVKKLGFAAIDLVGPKDWPTLKQHGVYSSMCNGAEINLADGWNRTEFHPQLIKNYTEHINLVSAAGYKNLILFSGNRRGMDDETGLKNCVTGLKQVLSLAEKKGVVLQLELFNSKIDHKDYMADKSAWGVELCKRLGSENFKLLYDIYHMQINEGDVIRTIQNDHQYFGHYHTAGVPGRHELDENQELYYPAIMKAIVGTGYKGFVAQEFITTGKTNSDKIKALKKAVKLCDV